MIGYGLAKKRLRCTFVGYKFGEERPLQTGDMIGSFRTCGKNRVYKRPYCHTPEVFEDSCSRPQLGWINEERAPSEFELLLFFSTEAHELQLDPYFLHYYR